MVRYTLSKKERLSSLKDIEWLFTQGKSLTKYPLRLVWRETPPIGELPVRVMFSVSKKNFRGAVDRNRIKRLMRESYRLLKPDFYQTIPAGHSLDIGIIYTGKEMTDLQTIQKSMGKALERLITQSPQV